MIVDVHDESPVAISVDSFSNALGEGDQGLAVIVRLFHESWSTADGLVPENQIYQFAISAPQAADLGRRLLELAAQAEKKMKGKPR
ncbi:hypothetical protein RGQ15_07055 [Paracoccus sp. MBLB3053]|uniref:Uncharacterized protein n=1 Tax=Paracoccus aurantius TaxID=3073814 RepID=A0ABU2HQL7_9RHOB|nr:hypothetical protein [Paracoccus sp. MBLB3053]MDS9467331.1 hypothetical protein [Paracoccus sp. MBLB3053]